jgi:hypothetical protein
VGVDNGSGDDSERDRGFEADHVIGAPFRKRHEESWMNPDLVLQTCANHLITGSHCYWWPRVLRRMP